MRHQLFKIVAFILLGLGELFLGAHSTPTNKVPSQQVSLLPIHERGYSIQGPTGESGTGWGDVFDVRRNNGKLRIDELSVDATKNTITVLEAWNDDRDKDAGRIKLRGILLDVWRQKSGKSVGELKSIHYYCVTEDSAKSAIKKAFTLMAGTTLTVEASGTKKGGKASFKTTLTVEASGTREGEKAAFETLLTGNTFGIGTQKMLAEYVEMEHRYITAFRLLETLSGLEMYIDLDTRRL